MYEKYKEPKDPSPRELFDLASVALSIGSNGKSSRYYKKHHGFYVSGEFCDFIDPLVTDQRHDLVKKYVGKVSRNRSDSSWRMAIAEVGYFFDGSDMVDAYRVGYSFRWTGRGVLSARRFMQIYEPEEEVTYDYLVPEVPEAIYEADFVASSLQYALMNRDDCRFLAKDMKDFDKMQKALAARG